MTNDKNSDGVEASIAEIIAMFHGELASVSFPGVDADSLEAALEAVSSQVADVDRLSRAHREAIEALHTQQRALREHARQALAYARVFANGTAGNPELGKRLDRIALDDSPVAIPKKRRGRRPKAIDAAPLLALDDRLAAIPADASAQTGGRLSAVRSG